MNLTNTDLPELTDTNLPKLTDLQRQVIIGTLLGDAHLETSTKGRTYRLLIEHSIKQKEYTDHLYEIFKPIVSTPPKEHIHQYTLACGAKRESKNIGFKTRVHSGLRYYGQMFYKDKVKRIPENIHKMLNPAVLAYWYMDDGSLKGKDRSGKVLHTEGFTFSDVQILSDALKTLGVANNIHNQHRKVKNKEQVGENEEVELVYKDYKIIYITAAGDKVFTDLIRPYVIDCFKNKM